MEALLTIFFFLLIIGFLVFVHEFGHFAAAKLSKVDVIEFAIGFGPLLFEKKLKETKYQIRAIPLGGYVNLEGEHRTDAPGGFRSKPLTKKIFILSAGVLMNILTATIFLGVHLELQDYRVELPALADYTFHNTESQEKLFPIVIASILEGGTADGQLQINDILVGFDGELFDSVQGFKEGLEKSQGELVTVHLLDLDTFEIYTKEIEMGFADENGNILNAGFILPFEHGYGDDERTYFVRYKESFISGIFHTYDLSVFQIEALGNIISNSISSGDYSELSNTVGGPVALGDNVNDVVESEIYEAFFFLTALISISLALVNILPIPALDGGQIAVAIFESIRGKRISDTTLEKINVAGFVFIIALSALITLKDIISLDLIDSVKEFIKSALGK